MLHDYSILKHSLSTVLEQEHIPKHGQSNQVTSFVDPLYIKHPIECLYSLVTFQLVDLNQDLKNCLQLNYG